MKIRLVRPEADYLNDVQEVPRAFFPFIEADPEAEHFLEWNFSCENGVFQAFIVSDVFGKARRSLTLPEGGKADFKKRTKRFFKNFLYDFLSEKFGVALPYGSLTGVRPTRLFYEFMSEGKDPSSLLKSEFRVSEEKVSLIETCVDNQRGLINSDPDAAALFLNVPVCPTRCSYCSFISAEAGRVAKDLPRYADCARRELSAIKRALSDAGKRVTSVYVGGGTPGSVGARLLNELLEELNGFGTELTVEAGRPDTIDGELVEALKRNRVTRVSVNPQSFVQRTLDAIGRRHTVERIYEAYELVRDDFLVNMDLIAGLPGDTAEDFEYSLGCALSLRPDNITVHSLSLKRGSALTAEGYRNAADGSAAGMTARARIALEQAGYSPYYMYRQKNTADNLENVGYALQGKQCVYNIDMMEESVSVLGAGAGAMSKLVSEGRIERLSNPKGFREYLDRSEEIIAAKSRFFRRGGEDIG